MRRVSKRINPKTTRQDQITTQRTLRVFSFVTDAHFIFMALCIPILGTTSTETIFWFSGLLRKILKQRSHNRLVYPTILHCVAQHFLECRESADHLAFREPSCSFERIDAIEGKSKVQAEDQDEAPKGPAKTAFMSLVMPYFHSAPYTSLKQRREEYSKFIEGLKYCCGRSSSTASKRTLGIHLPLTLDEYLNPALSEETLQVRNQDQVLVRYQIYKKPNKGKEMQETRDGQIDKKQVEKERGMQEEKGEKEVPPSAKLLTVQQAWIWYVNANLITAFPKNLLEDDEASRIEQFCESGLSYHAVGELLSLLVDTLDRPVMAGLSEPIFNVFEKSISTLSEQVNQYLKVPDVEAVRIEEEKRFFHEIGDIREELSMINSVLFQQEEVWKEFVSNVWPEHWKDGRLIIPLTDERPSGQWQKSKPPTDKWRIIARPQTQFSKFRRRLEKIDDDAQRVENSISKSLDLKAKHASIREAHSTAVMSSAVFGFTVITIIFTPLSFVVSLFALPIDRFQRHQIESRWTNEAGMYTTNYVGKFIATRELVSVTLTLVAMGLAIELGLKHGRNLKRLQGYVNQLWKLATEAKSNPVTDAAQNSSVCAKPANEYDQKPGETQWWRFGRRSRTRDNCRC
ncbi:hypothetical protein CC80DRAFT_308762 [Byssothecium circinans]|uniref:Uncharacterized protein n=1 Tax=Byssothecium circinans TaxID=147558 RepID=A0A6A5U6U4_9PLEO|nr:hypothetical protein CC80DRAFT_308762 [Byssothecium circinans]